MNKILLISVSVLGLFLSSEAYCTCKPLSVPTCKCQFPVYDGKELKCGDSYCPTGTECQDNGACCTKIENCSQYNSDCTCATCYGEYEPSEDGKICEEKIVCLTECSYDVEAGTECCDANGNKGMCDGAVSCIFETDCNENEQLYKYYSIYDRYLVGCCTKDPATTPNYTNSKYSLCCGGSTPNYDIQFTRGYEYGLYHYECFPEGNARNVAISCVSSGETITAEMCDNPSTPPIWFQSFSDCENGETTEWTGEGAELFRTCLSDCSKIENCLTYDANCACATCKEGYTAKNNQCVQSSAKNIADLCTNGIIIQDKYCISNTAMCWAASDEWCKKQNLVLVPIKEMCPSWDGTQYRENKCPEFVGSGYEDPIWSAKIYDDGASYFALYVTSSGMLGVYEQYYDGFPLCEGGGRALCYLP